jgi:dynein heavy chain, axonemal
MHGMSPPLRASIMAMCKDFHQDVAALSDQYRHEAGRINYVTPTSYLELITAFTSLLGTKRGEVGTLVLAAACLCCTWQS